MARATRRKPADAAFHLERARLSDERRARYAAVQGKHPKVMEVATPSGTFFLCRRLAPLDLLATDLLPQPLTQVVRKMMRMGMSEAQGENDEDYERYLATCAALVKIAALVPPPAFLDGDVDLDDLDPAECLPLFVDADPLEGQYVFSGYGQPPVAADVPTLSLSVNDLTFAVTILLSAGPPSAPLLLFRVQPGGAVAGLDDLEDLEVGASVQAGPR